MVNRASHSGAQQVDKLRAVDDLKKNPTSEATFMKTPINLPPWPRIAQMCALFDLKGESRLLAVAKADRADANK